MIFINISEEDKIKLLNISCIKNLYSSISKNTEEVLIEIDTEIRKLNLGYNIALSTYVRDFTEGWGVLGLMLQGLDNSKTKG